MPQFNSTFIALLKEAQFTKELLGSGVTQIRRANYATKGIYFQAFSSLSTGLERIGKLCLMLDYYAQSAGKFPDFDYLAKKIGHKLRTLQEKAEEVTARRNIALHHPSKAVHKRIVDLLSDFAEGDRYSNINLLVGASQKSDPISAWHTSVDLPLFEVHVTEAKKRKIDEVARFAANTLGRVSQVLHTSETGSEITDFGEASSRTGLWQAVAPYRQLYVLHIVRYWSELLIALQYIAMGVRNDDIPYFSEIFGMFCNEDSYNRTRKTWGGLT